MNIPVPNHFPDDHGPHAPDSKCPARFGQERHCWHSDMNLGSTVVCCHCGKRR